MGTDPTRPTPPPVPALPPPSDWSERQRPISVFDACVAAHRLSGGSFPADMAAVAADTPPDSSGALRPGPIAYAGRMVDALSVVHSDPEISGGMPVFRGTRVPVQALFDYLEGGETLDQFLDQFPSVSKQQALAALDLARNSVLACARST